MRWFAGILLVSMALAGCIDADDDILDAGTQLAEGADVQGSGDGNATLGPLVDPWANETHLVLYDRTHPGTDCLVVGTAAHPEMVTASCHWQGSQLDKGEGPFIPEGTETLQVEVDATDALQSGSYVFYLYTLGRATPDEANTQRTDSPTHTWTIDVTPLDWDPPERNGSGATLGFWSQGEGLNRLAGDIDVKITAERAPDWKPRHRIDAFADEDHDLVADGIIRLADVNGTWTAPPPATTGLSQQRPDPIPLRVVPPGTDWIVYGVDWDADCPPLVFCELEPRLMREGRMNWCEPLEWTTEHLICASRVPDVFLDDGIDAQEGTAFAEFYDYRCLRAASVAGAHVQDCWATWYATEADTQFRFLAEAWDQEYADDEIPDEAIEAFKARLGAA